MPMETRSHQSRLDQHEEQLLKLQSDVQEIKSVVQALDSDRLDEAEFRKFVMSWVKQQDKQTSFESGGVSVLSGVSSNPQNPPGSGSSNNGPQSGPTDLLPWVAKKVKLPEFCGFDPQGWFQKAELYFEIHGTPNHLRIRLAQLSMSGVAQHWFTIVKQVYDSMGTTYNRTPPTI